MGIWLAVQAAQYFCFSIPQSISILNSLTLDGLLNFILAFAPLCVTFFGACLMIKKTDFIYGLVGFEESETSSNISPEALQAIVIAGIGLYTLSYSLPTLINNLIQYFIHIDHDISTFGGTLSGIKYRILANLLSTALGLFLIVKTAKLSQLLSLLRTNQNHLP